MIKVEKINKDGSKTTYVDLQVLGDAMPPPGQESPWARLRRLGYKQVLDNCDPGNPGTQYLCTVYGKEKSAFVENEIQTQDLYHLEKHTWGGQVDAPAELGYWLVDSKGKPVEDPAAIGLPANYRGQLTLSRIGQVFQAINSGARLFKDGDWWMHSQPREVCSFGNCRMVQDPDSLVKQFSRDDYNVLQLFFDNNGKLRLSDQIITGYKIEINPSTKLPEFQRVNTNPPSAEIKLTNGRILRLKDAQNGIYTVIENNGISLGDFGVRRCPAFAPCVAPGNDEKILGFDQQGTAYYGKLISNDPINPNQNEKPAIESFSASQTSGLNVKFTATVKNMPKSGGNVSGKVYVVLEKPSGNERITMDFIPVPGAAANVTVWSLSRQMDIGSQKYHIEVVDMFSNILAQSEPQTVRVAGNDPVVTPPVIESFLANQGSGVSVNFKATVKNVPSNAKVYVVWENFSDSSPKLITMNGSGDSYSVTETMGIGTWKYHIEVRDGQSNNILKRSETKTVAVRGNDPVNKNNEQQIQNLRDALKGIGPNGKVIDPDLNSIQVQGQAIQFKVTAIENGIATLTFVHDPCSGNKLCRAPAQIKKITIQVQNPTSNRPPISRPIIIDNSFFSSPSPVTYTLQPGDSLTFRLANSSFVLSGAEEKAAQPKPEPRPVSFGPTTIQNLAKATGQPITTALLNTITQSLKWLPTTDADKSLCLRVGNCVVQRVSFNANGITYVAVLTGSTMVMERDANGKPLYIKLSVHSIEPQNPVRPITPAPRPSAPQRSPQPALPPKVQTPQQSVADARRVRVMLASLNAAVANSKSGASNIENSSNLNHVKH